MKIDPKSVGFGPWSSQLATPKKHSVEDDAMRKAEPLRNYATKRMMFMLYFLIVVTMLVQEPLVTVASALLLYVMASYYR